MQPPIKAIRNAVLAALGMGVSLQSCSHELSDAARRDALERSHAAIDANAEPASPRVLPEDGSLELNTEYWLGSSEDDERAKVMEFGKQIQELQKQAAAEHKTAVLRGFHAKSHGCLHGELTPRADRDPRTRYGIFAEGATAMPIWVRYSNGVGWRQSDHELDARGMAMKVMGVPGKKYLDDEATAQDFLMTNSPVPVGKDAAEFMKFAHANAQGRVAGVFFLLGHLTTSGPALTRTGEVDSAVTETYWSGGPAHLGAHQAVKYLAKPCDGSPSRTLSRDADDYLRQDLIAAAKEGICYTFYVQFQVDPYATPIENASVEWEEKDSPPVAVADILLPPQDLATNEFCDALAFHPWHAIAAHKPMGNHNRARRIVYSASQSARGHSGEPAPAQEPPAQQAPTSPAPSDGSN